uniref:Reverse transcriptase Ty1/copia-type domain-containing protein n=1 Tax=Fagus sylvatica TaxID=28930 RepID=A0A2N9J0W4_FAGSY
MQPPLLPHSGVKLLSLQCTPSTNALHLSFRTKHHMNGCLARPQTTINSRFLDVSVFFFNHMNALNFNPTPNYVVFLAMALKKRGTGVMIQSPSGNSDPQDDPLPDLFLEIPSTFADSANPISNESPLADPISDESPIAYPTFNESPFSAPAVNHVNTTAPEPRHSHRVSTLPSHLRDFHCFSAFATLHEPHTFREASSDPLWQQAMKEELDALLKTDGTIDHYKAHFVAKGFTQEYGIDYEETFAPVARLSSVRTLIAVSASQTLTTFSDGSLPFLQHGFSASSYDSALFFRRSDHGITFLLLYFLSLEVSSSFDGYYLTQAKYTSDLISRAGITDSKIVDTPIEYNNRMNTHDGEPLLDATHYKQLVRSLVYLTVTRPNISYAVYIVSQFMATLRSLHYVAILRILRGAYRPSFHYRDLGVDCSTIVLIHCDNRSAIKIAHNDVFHERTKHIEIDCHFVRHHLQQGDPDAISKVPGRKDINYLDGCTNSENLQLLNLMILAGEVVYPRFITYGWM